MRGMKMAVEFQAGGLPGLEKVPDATQAPTDNELAGHSEACRARHFPELQPPLCYGWSSFKSKKKQKDIEESLGFDWIMLWKVIKPAVLHGNLQQRPVGSQLRLC